MYFCISFIRLLLPFIKELCNSYEILNERAISINSIDKGVIKIGLIYSAAYTWFSDLMAEFKEKYPNVKYEFMLGSSEEIQNMVKSETVDFGIVYSPVISELIDVKIMEEELCLLGAKTASGNSRICFEETKQLNFIFSKGNEEFSLLEEIVCKKGLRLKKGMETPDLMSSFTMAEKGLGQVVVNRALADKFKCNISVVDFDFNTRKEIAVVLNDLNRISRTAKCFLDSLVEKYCQQE